VTGVRSELLEAVRCKSTTSLTAVEAAELRGISGDAPAPGTSLVCEIAAGHDGSHTALATISDSDQLWWLCWGDRAREVCQIPLCDGRDLDDPYLDECLLPEGHSGPHSYEIPSGWSG
jgi:hypothetical protein